MCTLNLLIDIDIDQRLCDYLENEVGSGRVTDVVELSEQTNHSRVSKMCHNCVCCCEGRTREKTKTQGINLVIRGILQSIRCAIIVSAAV